MSFGQRIAPLPPPEFTPVIWQAMTTLPLQIGIWIGRVDPVIDDYSSACEKAAIPDFLRIARSKFSNLPLIVQILEASAENWRDTLNPLLEKAVIAKCIYVCACLKTTTTPINVNAYKLVLIEMAEYVARAAPDRQPGAYNLMNGAKNGWYGLYPAFLNRTLRYGRGPRVSYAEKLAINHLITTLEADHMVTKWALGTPEHGAGVRIYSEPRCDGDVGGQVNQRTARAKP